MKRIQHNNGVRLLLVSCALFLALGAFLLASGDMTAQTSTPQAMPSGLAKRLSDLSGQPNELEFVYVNSGASRTNGLASTNTENTYYSTRDTTVVQAYPNTNFGSQNDMWAGYLNSFDDGEIVRSLVRFNVSGIPSGSAISSAKLYLYMGIAVDPADIDRTISTFQITDPWGELTTNWNNQPGTGLAGGTTDIPNAPDGYGEYEFDVTNIVAGWASGSFTNYGFMITGPESAADGAYRGFSTREGAIPPRLVVEYEAPTPTNTPTGTATNTPTSTSTPTETGTPTNTPTPSDTPTITPTPIIRYSHMPVIASNFAIISGRVVDELGDPIPGVLIQTDQGPSETTDADGFYMFSSLPSGVYVLTPILEGYSFAPSSRSASIPEGAVLQNFVADQLPPTATPTATDTPTATSTPTITPTATNTPTPTNTPTATATSSITCSNLVVNSSFEDNSGWNIPTTQYTAAFDTTQKHTGLRSMRTGIISPPPNVESYSSTSQVVTIPAGATQADLNFWLLPKSTEPAYMRLPTLDQNVLGLESMDWVGDVQLVLILDPSDDSELSRLIAYRQNDNSWRFYSVDLLSFAGQQIKLYFGTFNNGMHGVTGLYVDDVTLQVCQSN